MLRKVPGCTVGGAQKGAWLHSWRCSERCLVAQLEVLRKVPGCTVGGAQKGAWLHSWRCSERCLVAQLEVLRKVPGCTVGGAQKGAWLHSWRCSERCLHKWLEALVCHAEGPGFDAFHPASEPCSKWAHCSNQGRMKAAKGEGCVPIFTSG